MTLHLLLKRYLINFGRAIILNHREIRLVKHIHRNVKIGLSLGGDTVKDKVDMYFAPKSKYSWVNSVVQSLTKLITKYHTYDICRKHWTIITLKKNKIILFASIATYEGVQGHYLALWKKYGHTIDYVDFQFYAYEKWISVSQIFKFFDEQASNYAGGYILASFDTAGDRGLQTIDGLFKVCSEIKRKQKLGGIFVWCADKSQKFRF
ncbi:hypothetical protein MKW98_020019 [Papaver atlanticum]|uniref:GH18 domain-containing protein n=1 Tax=Papaver atlanticum TaxID=357466 RepID=A0AAD4S1E2_9MAGN|nr:hypothetical protein MKW98_020019 [Papaver atlanticum]